jgi:hypothetical protein
MTVSSPFEIAALMEPFTMHLEGNCAAGARPPPACLAELKQLPERLSGIMYVETLRMHPRFPTALEWARTR